MRKVKRILTLDEWLKGVTRHIRRYLQDVDDPDGQTMEYFECPFCTVFHSDHEECSVQNECSKYEEQRGFDDTGWIELFALQVYQEYREKFMDEGAGENPQSSTHFENHPDSPFGFGCAAGTLKAPSKKAKP